MDITGDRLQMTRIHELLGNRDCRVSYASLQRFVARRHWRRRTKATVRMEEAPPQSSPFRLFSLIRLPCIRLQNDQPHRLVQKSSFFCTVSPLSPYRRKNYSAPLRDNQAGTQQKPRKVRKPEPSKSKRRKAPTPDPLSLTTFVPSLPN